MAAHSVTALLELGYLFVNQEGWATQMLAHGLIAAPWADELSWEDYHVLKNRVDEVYGLRASVHELHYPILNTLHNQIGVWLGLGMPKSHEEWMAAKEAQDDREED